MRAILKMLGVTYIITPSQKIIVHRRTELGTKVTVHCLRNSKILRILAQIL
jgi:hypothetical protein